MKSTIAEHGQNNLLSYCGLVDVRISASEKDLPVICFQDSNVTIVCPNAELT